MAWLNEIYIDKYDFTKSKLELICNTTKSTNNGRGIILRLTNLEANFLEKKHKDNLEQFLTDLIVSTFKIDIETVITYYSRNKKTLTITKKHK